MSSQISLKTSKVAFSKTTLPGTEDAVANLDEACKKLLLHRKTPLLVLYYPTFARISEDDLDDVYDAFRTAGVRPEGCLASLDVLIDSNGGDPAAGYRLAQLIRDFAHRVSFLVPDHAYSAATLLCFCGNEVRLGHYAGLSPIDITLVSESSKKPRQEVELASIDSFMDFAEGARRKIEELLEKLGCDGSTNVDSDLLVSMVKEVGAFRVGKFYRERATTGHYAEELLDDYMFCDLLDRRDKRNQVIRNFLFGAPSHEFHLDYHLSSKWGLSVAEMSTDESDLSKAVIAALEGLTEAGIICPNVSRYEKIPFIRLYRYQDEKVVASEEKHETNEADART